MTSAGNPRVGRLRASRRSRCCWPRCTPVAARLSRNCSSVRAGQHGGQSDVTSRRYGKCHAINQCSVLASPVARAAPSRRQKAQPRRQGRPASQPHGTGVEPAALVDRPSGQRLLRRRADEQDGVTEQQRLVLRHHRPAAARQRGPLLDRHGRQGHVRGCDHVGQMSAGRCHAG
jgi:hypothetical protein